MDILSELPKLPFWKDLNTDERELVRAYASIQSFPAGVMLQSCNDGCLGMIYLLSGHIRVYLLSPEGREITLFRLETGDPCVLSASCVISQITFETHIQVERDCRLLVVGIPAFGKLAEENIHVRCFMYELTTQRFSSVMWAMQQLLFARFDQRLASFLLQEAEHTGCMEIAMTHEQIAQQISSAREVVARMLKRFASEDIVEMKRGKIRIKNLKQLQKIAQN